MTLAVGDTAPDFTLISNHREPVSRDSLLGRKSLIVFIPFAFTGTCTGEVCELQENLGELGELGAQVVVITCNTVAANAAWAKAEGLDFPILSDFWPHGAVSKAYGTFNDQLGCAMRWTFVVGEDGVITEVFKTEDLRTPRPYQEYVGALS